MSHGAKITVPKFLVQPKKSRHLFLKFLATVAVLAAVKTVVTLAVYGPPPYLNSPPAKAVEVVPDLHCPHTDARSTDTEADAAIRCYRDEAVLRLKAHK